MLDVELIESRGEGSEEAGVAVGVPQAGRAHSCPKQPAPRRGRYLEAPDGQRFERDLVHHPGAVVMVPVDKRTNEVIFVRQYRAPLDRELLEVPAGKRERERRAPRGDGSPGASRGNRAEAGRLQLIGHFFNSPGFSDEESWCFLATDLHTVPDERHGIEEEHMTVERYPLSHVDELVRSGEITDAKTIIGLFLASSRSISGENSRERPKLGKPGQMGSAAVNRVPAVGPRAVW